MQVVVRTSSWVWRFLWCAMLVAGGAVEAQQGTGPVGTLQGSARTEGGEPVPAVTIVIEGFAPRATTRDDGTFVLGGIPAGIIRVTARRLGYLPARRELTVPAGGTLRVDFTMRPAPTDMTPIAVTARREPYDARLSGFRARAEAGAAGYIFTRDRIEQSANRNTLDLVRTVPGVRVVTNSRGAGQARTIRFRSNRCPPTVFIDGFAASAAEFDLESIDLHMVEGIEVYLSSASLPPEFFAVSRGLEQCGVIAIWSRPAQARAPRPRRPADAGAAETRRTAFAADSVDEVAYIHGGDPEIVYPDSLWRAEADGEVTLEFVVDERGRLDWSSLLVVNETHPYFTRAVLEALAPTQWEPARRGGRRVSQLVRLPVKFSR
jgi:TonB family protein